MARWREATRDYAGTPYHHYCGIELGPVMRKEALVKLVDIRERFPEPEFKVYMTYVHCVGHSVEFTAAERQELGLT